MKKEIIKDKNQILVLILRNGDFPQGLNFHTEDEDFVQVATWNYQKGKRSSLHSHKIVKRVANRTQEVIYLKKGKIKGEIYTDDDKFLKEIILKEGDLAIIFAGGHAFEVLEDNTQVLEIKNGPYPGLKKDKREFQPQKT
jgi:quercetin dioxygenase-like cupin family protein